MQARTSPRDRDGVSELTCKRLPRCLQPRGSAGDPKRSEAGRKRSILSIPLGGAHSDSLVRYAPRRQFTIERSRSNAVGEMHYRLHNPWLVGAPQNFEGAS